MTQDDEQRALEAANRLLTEIGVHHPEQVGIDPFLTDVHRVATVYVQSSKASEGAGDAIADELHRQTYGKTTAYVPKEEYDALECERDALLGELKLILPDGVGKCVPPSPKDQRRILKLIASIEAKETK